jgi:DNA-binding IclR family transcriptional regulator
MDSVTGVGTLDKAMTVLRCVAEAPCSLGELTAATGLPRATAHRLASALVDHGMLRRDRRGRFDLGNGLLALGRAAEWRFPIVEQARPVLEALRDETGESVQLFVRAGDRRSCVLSLESPHGLRWIVPEGALLPLEVGSAGRLLLGEPAPDGWIQSVGERESGVASVSAPVVGADGSRLAAVSVSGPIERLTAHPGDRFGALVVAAASAIARWPAPVGRRPATPTMTG